MRKIQISIIIIAVAAIAFGFYRAETNSILQKAVMVCLECIGIG